MVSMVKEKNIYYVYLCTSPQSSSFNFDGSGFSRPKLRIIDIVHNPGITRKQFTKNCLVATYIIQHSYLSNQFHKI